MKKGEKIMKTKKEIVAWLLSNCVDEEGNLDLDGLDFQNFAGDVHISGIYCKGDIWQCAHQNDGQIYQSYHKNGSNIYQHSHDNAGKCMS